MRYITIIIDWVINIVMIIAVFSLLYVQLGDKKIDLNDPSIYNKYHGDTISMLSLIIISFVPNFIIIGLSVYKKKNMVELLYEKITTLIFIGFFSAIIYSIINTLVASFRPDFMEVCDFDFERFAKDNLLKNGTEGVMANRLASTSYCRANPKTVKLSGMSSFPSGHTTVIFSTMSYGTYLLYQFLRTKELGGAIKPFLNFIPLIIAVMVGVSRIVDNRHHKIDVFVGMLIGIFTAVATIIIKKKDDKVVKDIID